MDGHFDDVKTFAHTFLGAGVGGFPGFMRKLPRYRRARGRVLNFLRDVIVRHRDHNPNGRPPDVIDLLLNTTTPTGGPLTELDISVAPFPAPARDFRVRIVKRRPAEKIRGRPAQALEVDLAGLLPAFDATSLSNAAARAETRRFQPGKTIIRQGEVADAFYIVTSGKVEVIKEGTEDGPKTRPERSRRIVAQLGEGDYFGEIGLLQGVPRTATVRAVPAVEAIVLDRETFTALVAEGDLTSGEIADIMRRRLMSTTLAVALPRLTLEQVAEISPRFELIAFEPGATVIREGEPADRFCIIVRGKVEIVNRHPNGQDIYLGTLGEGEYFGEIGLIQGRPRNATVRASEDGVVEVMALGREAFLAMMTSSNSTCEQIALRMAERLIDIANEHKAFDEGTSETETPT